MTEQLKPCPFCGGINVIHSGYRMYCHACGAEGPDADSADESAAIAAWNRRAQPAQAGAEPVAWRNAAIRVGEDLCSVGPYGYYDMTADQWLDWALSVVTVHAPARVPLTDEELRMISKQQDPVVVLHHNVLAFAHAIIAAYEAKNGIGGGK
jgi:Lar family restriction alleviation protein